MVRFLKILGKIEKVRSIGSQVLVFILVRPLCSTIYLNLGTVQLLQLKTMHLSALSLHTLRKSNFLTFFLVYK